MTEAQEALVRAAVEELVNVRKALVAIGRHLGAFPPAQAKAAPTTARSWDQRGLVAPDRDLDSQYGDPAVKFDPWGWNGESFKGSRLSQCSPEYLDALAEVFDDNAEKEEDEKKRRYKRGDAARARGWARRQRAQAQATDAPPEDFA